MLHARGRLSGSPLAFDTDSGKLAALNKFGKNSGSYLLAVAAGLLLTAAFPKIGVAGFAWIAPALMLAAAQGKRGGEAFGIGYVAGLAHFLSSLYWLTLMPVTGLPILAWVALSAYVALYPAAWTWMNGLVDQWIAGNTHPSTNPSIHQSWARRFLWSLGGAASWVGLEMVRAHLLTGFPWNLVGVSQYKLIPLIQIASVTGAYGVSFLVVWLSLTVYSAVHLMLRQPNTRLIWQAEIILPLLVIVGLFVFGFARLSGENPAPAALRVTLVQPSVPQTLIWNAAEDARRFQELLAQSAKALEKTGLLVWPESAVPETDEATCRAISNFAQTNHVWIILNGEDAEIVKGATNYYNAAGLISPDGRWLETYHKRRLVIFGEYVPLANWLPFVKYLTPITGGWTPGDKPVQFSLQVEGRETSAENKPFAGETNVIALGGHSTTSSRQSIKTSPLICFEDVFPGLARDSASDDTDFLVNLTNDGWFRQSAEQWQHMASAVFRAVENGRPLVRCANNGITCWIDASGRIREKLRDNSGSVYGNGAMTVDIPVGANRGSTFYHRHGDWFGWSCVVLTAALAARRISGRRKQLFP